MSTDLGSNCVSLACVVLQSNQRLLQRSEEGEGQLVDRDNNNRMRDINTPHPLLTFPPRFSWIGLVGGDLVVMKW